MSRTGLPMTVPIVHVAGSDPDVFGVSVCINNTGPYPFELDTGSTISVILPDLANRLELPIGPPVNVAGVASPLATSRISDMVLGPVRIDSSDFLREFTRFEGFDGILGGDILSRFGAIEIDLSDNQVTFAESQVNIFNASISFSLYGRSVDPSWLNHRFPRYSVHHWVGAIMFHNGAGIVPVVNVAFGRGSAQKMVLDSGAAVSSISTSAAHAASLDWSGEWAYLTRIGGTQRVKLDEASNWRVNGQLLPTTYLWVGPGSESFAGSIGSNVLGKLGYFIVDYHDAEVLLG